LSLADHRHRLEIEAVEGLADRQAGFGKMALDAAAAAVGDLVLGERRQEARCRPAFLVGLLGELSPHLFDRGQTQIGEEELDTRGIDGVSGLHATPPSSTSSAFG
jgi:hypothetical protein